MWLVTYDLYDNNNKKYKMINECDPAINQKKKYKIPVLKYLKE